MPVFFSKKMFANFSIPVTHYYMQLELSSV